MTTVLKGEFARPIVSVIVPIYNVQDYLAQCLDSLVGQTLADIEIIAIDDGSTDGSFDILQRYSAEYPNLFKVFRQTNAGLSASRNFGIDVSTGKYIAFVDSDDWVDLHMFDEMVSRATESDSDIVVCAMLRHADDDLKPSNLDIRGHLSDFGQSVADNPNLLYASRSYACNKLFLRTLFANGRHRFPIGQWYEDSATIYPLMDDAVKISCVAKRFYHYRSGRPGAITSTLSPKIFDIFKSCNMLLEYYGEKARNSPELYATLQRIICNHVLVRFELLLTSRASEKWLAIKYIMHSFKYLNQHFPNWRVHRKRRRTNILSVYASLFVPGRSARIESYRIKRRAIRQSTAIVKQQKDLQTHGFLVLEILGAILDRMSVSYFADRGTLLGLIRDGAFMSHEVCLSIGVFATERQKPLIKLAMESSGLKLGKTYVYRSRVVAQSHIYVDGDVEVEFKISYYESVGETARTWQFYEEAIIQYPEAERSVLEMNHLPIEGTSMIDVDGHSVPIPSNPEKLLEERYGTLWRTPDKDWTYSRSPAARILDGFGEIR